mgnify:CR=1 FL=1
MGRVFKRELYVLSHSLVFWIFIIAMMMFSVFTTFAGAANKSLAVEGFYLNTGEPTLDDTFDELAKDIYEIWYNVEDIESVPQERYIDREGHGWVGQIFYVADEQRYVFAPSVYEMLTVNPTISEKYGYLLERDDYQHGFEHHGGLFTQEEVEELRPQWAATATFNDVGGALIAALFVGAFVFGRSYSNRIYSADAQSGIKRRQMFFGRMCAYLIIAVLFSVTDVMLCFALFVPKGTMGLMSTAAFRWAFAARLLFDLLVYAVGMLFAVLIPKWFIAPIAGFAFLALLSRNMEIFSPLGKVLKNVWSGSGFVQPFMTLALCTLAAYAVTSAVCVFRLHRAQLK